VPYREPDPALPKLGARLALTCRALDLTLRHRHAYLGHRPNVAPSGWLQCRIAARAG
jgi:hypothetical protein